MNSYMKSVNINKVSSISEILSLRVYGFVTNKNNSTSTHSILVHSYERITCNDVTMFVNDMRLLYSSLISDIYDLLFDELLFNKPRNDFRSITLENAVVSENFNDNSREFNFLNNNSTLKKFNNYCQNLIFNDRELRNRFWRLNRSNNRLFLRLNIV